MRQAIRNKPKETAAEKNIPDWDDSAVRRVVQDETGPFYIATVTSTKLDLIATSTCHAAPDDIARLGFAIAHELKPESPPVAGLSDKARSWARDVSQALTNAKRPLVISGTSLGNEAIINAAANIAWALCKTEKPAELCYVLPECNSMGAGMMAGKNMREAFDVVHDGRTDAVIILENDLFRRADEKSIDDFLGKAKHVIVIDHLSNPTSSRAEVALPGGTFAESDGTFANNEGRAQRFYQVFKSNGDIQESWRWIRDIMTTWGRSDTAIWNNLDDITSAMIAALPSFKSVRDVAPVAGFRVNGAKIPRQPHRYSGRTAMLTNINVHEPKPPGDPDTPLSFSMEGYEGLPPASLISRYWSPGWNSVQALNKFQQEVGGPLYSGDPGKRLIEPSKKEAVSYYKNIPDAFEPKSGEWLVVPLYHIYGSEELSMLAPGIAVTAPQPYLVINPGDAFRINAVDSSLVQLSIASKKQQFSIRISAEMPAGIAGVFAGTLASLVFAPPMYGKIEIK